MKLPDEFKIETAWQHYLNGPIKPLNLSPDSIQYKETERAFKGGMISCAMQFKALSETLVKIPDDEAESLLKQWLDGIENDFRAFVVGLHNKPEVN